ncbi:hypothetical protein J1605_014961 [Eschrichtius robustus]|uniref:Neurobeachin-like protein 2 n=1 Tax=Eschrichtius robustus TaxID=9764 RepID=A0AB34GAQ8_ESCRO|nr:hypothetical protein J1605_014961 [Eschrichtius robustus]
MQKNVYRQVPAAGGGAWEGRRRRPGSLLPEGSLRHARQQSPRRRRPPDQDAQEQGQLPQGAAKEEPKRRSDCGAELSAGASRAQVTYSSHLYSVTGRLRASLPSAEQPTALAKVPVRSVAVTQERSHVLVDLEDGKLIVVGAGQPSEVRSCQFARELCLSPGETEYKPGEAR